MEEFYGIDVSRYQGTIDWSRVAEEKSFAIIRCTSGRSNALDSKFSANLRGALAQGMEVGVYRYGYATTVSAAREEAKAVVDAIRGYAMPCGVWYDAEDPSQRKLAKTQLTAIIQAFQQVVEEAGYWSGIYCNQDWYDNVLEVDAFDCPFWVARYGINDGQMHTKPQGVRNLWGWQYTSRGRVAGISGYVDLDVRYGKASSGGDPGDGVKPEETEPEPAQSFDKAYAGVYRTTTNLNLRTGPSTTNPSLVVLPQGVQVRNYGYYTQPAGGGVWLYVVATLDGTQYQGYCAKAYLSPV